MSLILRSEDPRVTGIDVNVGVVLVAGRDVVGAAETVPKFLLQPMVDWLRLIHATALLPSCGGSMFAQTLHKTIGLHSVLFS